MLTGTDESSRRARGVLVSDDGAVRVLPYDCRYSDLGAVIDAQEVAAGAAVYSTYYDDVQWSRHLVFLVQTDVTWDFGVVRRDSSGISSSADNWLANQTAVPTSWRPLIYGPSTGLTSGVVGYSARFFLRNVAPVPGDLALRVQMIGG